MNKIKAIFSNRKFSLDGLIDVICTLSGLVGLTVAIVGFGWFASTYPAETGAAVVCIVTIVLVCLVLAGIFDAVFPKNDDLEIDKWIERAEKELEKTRDPAFTSGMDEATTKPEVERVRCEPCQTERKSTEFSP